MISPPPNVVFSLVLVPIFEWEHNEPANDVPAQPAVADGEACGQTSQPDAASLASTAQRLVLKGFEWRPTAEYVLFPPAPWANCFDGGSNEANAESVKQENERRARAAEGARNHRAQLRVDHPHATPQPDITPPAESDGTQQS